MERNASTTRKSIFGLSLIRLYGPLPPSRVGYIEDRQIRIVQKWSRIIPRWDPRNISPQSGIKHTQSATFAWAEPVRGQPNRNAQHVLNVMLDDAEFYFKRWYEKRLRVKRSDLPANLEAMETWHAIAVDFLNRQLEGLGRSREHTVIRDQIEKTQ